MPLHCQIKVKHCGWCCLGCVVLVMLPLLLMSEYLSQTLVECVHNKEKECETSLKKLRHLTRTHGSLMSYEKFNAEYEILRSWYNESDPYSICKYNDDKTTLLDYKTNFPCVNNNEIELVLMLSQHHGGSKHLIDLLGNHPDVTSGKELSGFYWYYGCSYVGRFVSAIHYGDPLRKCTYKEFLQSLTWAYQKLLNVRNNCKPLKPYRKNNGNKHRIMFKLQLYDVEPDFFKHLILYTFCHNITVLHLVRSNALNTFWSWQSDTLERLLTFDIERIVNRNFRKSEAGYYDTINELAVDPAVAKTYVQLLEQNRIFWNKLFTLSPFHKHISYMIFYYEDMMLGKNDYNLDFYRMLSTYLNLTNPNNIFSLEDRQSVAKKHSYPCWKRVSNWHSIRNHFNNTESYSLCDRGSFYAL
ncbi:hypothetical protein RFI_09896 [Reticulomyxa filosa]|uniref:Uncharacterized protein n=1 Tax=Reticulomyxa filosa TaxID=46433 RepID=X6NPD6_RETFI|nr:hypothetical protein RFI_09896 [Reticulomyxa filosa]|eukprot:ETO27237.1 hypothetical protein RFI_09896 [Reticulomyxa filosa]